MKNSFVEITLFEVKPKKTEEFESLLERVNEHHRSFPGVKKVNYIKRTHRHDYKDAQTGKPAKKLTRVVNSVTYAMYWELENEDAHAKATKSALKKYYKDFSRCLLKMPKMVLGQPLEL